MSGGRWDYCQKCGSVGYVDWGYQLHGELGSCPMGGSWRGVGEDVIDAAAEECDRLNELEAAASPTPIDMDDLATIPSDDDPYGAFAYRGGNP